MPTSTQDVMRAAKDPRSQESIVDILCDVADIQEEKNGEINI